MAISFDTNGMDYVVLVSPIYKVTGLFKNDPKRNYFLDFGYGKREFIEAIRSVNSHYDSFFHGYKFGIIQQGGENPTNVFDTNLDCLKTIREETLKEVSKEAKVIYVNDINYALKGHRDWAFESLSIEELEN